MKINNLAIVQLITGIYEWIIINDTRRIRQVFHHIIRGIVIIFTLGRIKPKYINYFA